MIKVLRKTQVSRVCLEATAYHLDLALALDDARIRTHGHQPQGR